MSLFYGDNIKSIFWLAVQSSHLSLLLVARHVCCLSLGRQQSRLDSQSDGIIQPSIKLGGQQYPSCSSRHTHTHRERAFWVEYHKSNAVTFQNVLSLHMPTENQWGFFSCCISLSTLPHHLSFSFLLLSFSFNHTSSFHSFLLKSLFTEVMRVIFLCWSKHKYTKDHDDLQFLVVCITCS